MLKSVVGRPDPSKQGVQAIYAMYTPVRIGETGLRHRTCRTTMRLFFVIVFNTVEEEDGSHEKSDDEHCNRPVDTFPERIYGSGNDGQSRPAA
jgi:hypothetical protein